MRRSLVLPFLLSFATGQQPAAEPRNTPPRVATEPDLAPCLERAKAMLAAGADGEALLVAADLQPLREVREFRRLVREHAPPRAATMAPAGEPGTPLVVHGRVLDQVGRAVADAVVYAYSTSAKGWYSDRAPHFAGDGGDFEHARLFAYVRTDAEGRFLLRTVRPGGYPRSTLPEHIHWQAFQGGTSVGTGEVWFDDDPRLTAELRRRAGRGVVVATTERVEPGLCIRPDLRVDIVEPTKERR